MIRIHRTPEPAALASIRSSELQRVGSALKNGAFLTSELVGKAYRPMAPELQGMQHEKCCYCEWREQGDFNDVEHYRPKAEARRGTRFRGHERLLVAGMDVEKSLIRVRSLQPRGEELQVPARTGQ